MRLVHIVGKTLRQLRRERCLKRPRRNHDLARCQRPIRQLKNKPPVLLSVKLLDFAVQLDRELERFGVTSQVGEYLIATWIAVGIARERQFGQTAVAPRSEESEGLPAPPPGSTNGVGTIENHERSPLALQKVANRETRLACSDDGDINAHGVAVFGSDAAIVRSAVPGVLGVKHSGPPYYRRAGGKSRTPDRMSDDVKFILGFG